MKLETIEITHPDKILFPDLGITKAEMAQYYAKVAEKILPFLKDRPLTLVRHPSGIDKKGFYQKNASEYFPDFIKRIEVETEEGTNTQILCNNKKSLLYLVNQNTISFHIWLSKRDKIRQPNKVVFDLDPPKDSFDRIKEGAQLLREYLQQKNIEPKVMTTGKKGLHVYYKIRRGKEFDQVKEQVRADAEALVKLHPQLFTTQIRKDQREGKIFLDYLRNAYAQTAVCPYSLRPDPEAGIATPLEWKELETLKSASQFNLKNPRA